MFSLANDSHACCLTVAPPIRQTGTTKIAGTSAAHACPFRYGTACRFSQLLFRLRKTKKDAWLSSDDFAAISSDD
jgi:hypothetical protein